MNANDDNNGDDHHERDQNGDAATEARPDAARRLSRRKLIQAAGLMAATGAASMVHAGGKGKGPAGAGAPPFQVQGFPRYYPRNDHADEVSLAGKVAVITGASRGIGLAVGQALALANVTVIGTSRDPSAHPTHPFDLLPLDLTDAGSVGAFPFAVGSHPAVIANGGVDILINNAGRFSLGSVIPSDPAIYFPALEESMATLYGGHVGVTSGLLPLLIGRAAASGYARIQFTTSVAAYGVGGSEPGSSYYQSYFSGKRALLAYANSLRGFIDAAGLGIKVTTLNPYAVNTALAEGLNPIFTQPVDGLGNAVGDPFFQQFLDQVRLFLANGLPVEFAAQAFRQLLTMAEPLPNVAVGSDEEPFASQGGSEYTNAIGLAEMQESAFPFGCAPPGQS